MKTIAYYDTGHEFPEEIVSAVGMRPYKILGDVHAGTNGADHHLHTFVCPFSRACLGEGLARAGEWDGIVFSHGCDTTNRQYDVWRKHVETRFLYWLNTPMRNDPTAHGFHGKEFRRLIAHLEEAFGVTLSDEALWEAIRASNRVKGLLRQLSALRAVKDVPNPEYLDVLLRCVRGPKEGLEEHLKDTLALWQERPPFPEEFVPVLFTGSDVSYREYMEVLEAARLRAVRDDLSLGERYFARSIPEEGDPVEALVRYKSTIPQPATRVPYDPRFDYLDQCLAETPVKGVVYQVLKFCEPYGIDAPLVVRHLKRGGRRVLTVEREYTPTLDQQSVSRLESFRELL